MYNNNRSCDPRGGRKLQNQIGLRGRSWASITKDLDEFADTLTDLGRDVNAVMQGAMDIADAVKDLKSATNVGQLGTEDVANDASDAAMYQMRRKMRLTMHQMRRKMRRIRSKTPPRTRLKICKVPCESARGSGTSGKGRARVYGRRGIVLE